MTAFLKRKYHVFSKKYPVSQLWDRSGHNTAQELPAETNWASCIQVSAKCLSQKLIPNLPSSKKNTKHGSWTPLLWADLRVEAQGTASFSDFLLHSQNQPTTTNKNTEKRSADLLTRLLLDLYLPSQGWQLAFHRHQTKTTCFIFIWPPHFLFIWPTLFIFIWPARFIFIWPSRQKHIGQFYRFNAFALSREADGPGSQLPCAPAWPNSASSSASAGCCRLRQDLVSWPVQEKPLIFSVCCLPEIFSSHQLRNEVKKAGARAQICKY